MSQTICVINWSSMCYFLHASNQWCMCWHVCMKSHASHGEGCASTAQTTVNKLYENEQIPALHTEPKRKPNTSNYYHWLSRKTWWHSSNYQRILESTKLIIYFWWCSLNRQLNCNPHIILKKNNSKPPFCTSRVKWHAQPSTTYRLPARHE